MVSAPLSVLDTVAPAFFRLMPALVLFPVIGIDRLPAFVRVVFCLALSVCVAPAMRETGAVDILSLIAQFLLGLALALGIHACVAGLHTGSHLVDTQAGTNSTSIFNPSHNGGGVFAEFLLAAVAVAALLSDAVLIGLGKTLALTPASVPPDAAHAGLLLHAFGMNIVAGFLLTLPLVAGLWLVDVFAAFSSRLLPQANIYFLFLPVKTLFATLLFAAFSALFLAGSGQLLRHALTG